METLVLMIIIGIATTIFGKAKGNRRQSQSKPFSANSFKEIRTLVKKQLAYDAPGRTNPINTERKSEISLGSLENLENKYLQVKQESNPSRIGMSMAQQKVMKPKSDAVQEEEGFLLSVYPDETTLINGIIWAEILAEPRSKKPYTPRKY